MTLKEDIQKDGQRHLYVKSAITCGTTQYFRKGNNIFHLKNKFGLPNNGILGNITRVQNPYPHGYNVLFFSTNGS